MTPDEDGDPAATAAEKIRNPFSNMDRNVILDPTPYCARAQSVQTDIKCECAAQDKDPQACFYYHEYAPAVPSVNGRDVNRHTGLEMH